MSSSVTIVGAGLVGSLLSLYLARRGHTVTLLERRPDMRRAAIGAGRSINLAVSTRGLRALREVGLCEQVLERAVPMRGRMIHAPSGALSCQAYGKDDSEFINSISRGELNKTLMSAAEATGRVQIQFGQRLVGCDFTRRTVQLQDDGGEERSHAAPVLIGADGAGSLVRQAMQAVPGFAGTSQYLDYSYKELSIAPGPGGSFRLEQHALHIWPRGAYMLIALPNFDGSFTCTLFLPNTGEVSFAALRTPAAVRQLFERDFADALPLVTDLEETFFANPPGHMVTVKCAPWHVGGHALLVGDAAHAIVPFFGQGMNCGFEDCTILGQGLDALGDDWERLFQHFSATRKPHADAIADMAVENFIEMRDKVGNPHFLLRKEVEKRLQSAFVGEFLSRYAMVTFSDMPYRAAFDAGQVADGIVDELCTGLRSADDLDLTRAQHLIRSRFVPLLQAQRQGGSVWESP